MFQARTTFLPFSPPWITEDEVDEVVQTLRSEWITTGPKTKRFEESFRETFTLPECLALNSCTAGLHLSLLSHGIGEGDEVITTPLTFAATANVIEHVRACPVFGDVEKDTLNLDPKTIEAKLTPRTKAVLAVHYGGHPAELEALKDICERRKLVLIEDAAHAVAAKYKGAPIGTSGNLTSFSFYATKNLTTAEGGMLTGPMPLIQRARSLSLHGLSRDAWNRFGKNGSWDYDVTEPGFKYNMTDIQASLGICQLKRLPIMQRRRQEIVSFYTEAFRDQDLLSLPQARNHVESAWHLYVVRLQLNGLKISRNEFIEALKELNIGTSVHYRPVPLYSYYQNKFALSPKDFPVTMEAFESMVSLPLSARLSDRDAQDVVEAVSYLLKKYRR